MRFSIVGLPKLRLSQTRFFGFGNTIGIRSGCITESNISPTFTPEKRFLHAGQGHLQRLSHIVPLAFKSSSSNVFFVKNYEDYHNIVYSSLETQIVSSKDLLISLFFTKQSTSSLSVFESIGKIAEDFPLNKILIIDADVVPRSAYDADIQQFPSVLLSYGGDLYRQLIETNGGFHKDWQRSYGWYFKPLDINQEESRVDCVLPERLYELIHEGINKFHSSHNGRNISSIKSKAGTHSYTHGIDTDNLNLKRVGWPTE
ncbi:hypothetical protein BEWA_021770 [Theileria equi strain WA]|uniref:Thioredoxin-like fold domain-containing protein n=1 Tax=Theileria equi strain WA TaxID=1537102 RepID=L0AWQ0_THEEQ|nr:hypothetical protein BEWA_021770 [Theileria equi strain WA]AFZ79329.1 hypothetical protein BEWA_021770 [Theileria equi strain WA]|eukprot:XP_004828995.1 hypothetical protein BEWA_021770 [Theileria equi strain WA]